MTKQFTATLLLILAAMAAAPAHADTILISFAEPVINVVPGQTDVPVFATLTNTDPLNQVFLNSDSLSLPGASAINDEFFTNVPFSLDPGQVSGPIELFRFDVAPGVPAGTFTGSYRLFGGIGTSSQFNFDALAAQAFTVSIQGVPEPSEFLMLGTSLLILALLAKAKHGSRNTP